MCAHHFDYLGFLACSLFFGENVLSEHHTAEKRADCGARHRADFNHRVPVHVCFQKIKLILSHRHYVYGVCWNSSQPPYSSYFLCSMRHVSRTARERTRMTHYSCTDSEVCNHSTLHSTRVQCA